MLSIEVAGEVTEVYGHNRRLSRDVPQVEVHMADSRRQIERKGVGERITRLGSLSRGQGYYRAYFARRSSVEMNASATLLGRLA